MSAPMIPIELPGQAGFLATATVCMVIPTCLVVLRILGRRRTSLSLNGSDVCIVLALVGYYLALFLRARHGVKHIEVILTIKPI